MLVRKMGWRLEKQARTPSVSYMHHALQPALLSILFPNTNKHLCTSHGKILKNNTKIIS